MFYRYRLNIYSVRQLREITGLSQAQFSFRYDIPLDTIINWENRRRKPPLYVLEMLEIIIKREYFCKYMEYQSKLKSPREKFLKRIKQLHLRALIDKDACQLGTPKKNEKGE